MNNHATDLFHDPKKDVDTKDTEKKHYHGHRDRLRGRFADQGPDALADYELLELILFSAIPRRDVKPLAKELLSHFGSMNAIFNATFNDLEQLSGVSDKTAILIKTMQAVMHRMMKQEIMQQPILNSWQRLIEYCETTMAHEKKEHFRVLYMNIKNELIADEVQQSGTVNHTPVYPREVIKRALELSATSMIIVHNHPSGDPKPSEDDIDMTFAIKAAAEPFNIVLHDHLIVSKNGTSSFKTQGIL